MSFPNAVHTVKSTSTKSSLPKFNPALLRRPSPLPQRPLAPNRFRPPQGEKQVYLPNFVLTFIRSPHLPPNYATFLTPLWFNKLDIKDYLYHVYGLQVLNVRSYVIQSKVRQDKPRARIPRPHRWFRPASKKKMTVELVPDAPRNGPFIWPQEPEDLTPWGRKNAEQMIEAIKDGRVNRAEKSEKWPTDAGTLSREARNLVRKARLKRQAESGGEKEEDGRSAEGEMDGEETNERAVT